MLEHLKVSPNELTNNQQNIWKLIDAHNKLVDWLEDNIEQEEAEEVLMKKGVSVTANGRYLLDGKFIKKEDAFL